MPVHPILRRHQASTDGRSRPSCRWGRWRWRRCSIARTVNPCGRFPMSPVEQTDVPTEWTVADAADSQQAAGLRRRRRHDRRSDQLHAGAAREGAAGDQGISDRRALRAAVARRARREQGHDRRARLRRRRQLAIRRVGSRDGLRVRRIDHQTVRRRRRENRSARSEQSGVHGRPRRSGAECSRICRCSSRRTGGSRRTT